MGQKIKYSIIIPFYHVDSIKYTFMSFLYHYANRKDFEIIIIEDSKCEIPYHNCLTEAIIDYKGDLNINWLRLENEGFMAVTLRNYGVRQAIGDIIILTSPECFHLTNILNGLDKEFKHNKNKYVVCACRNVNVPGDKQVFNNFTYAEKEWYQHSELMNRNYHFCIAMLKSKYLEIGGFDEEYNKGLWYDDDDFLLTIKKANIPIIPRDDLVTLHIDHERKYQVGKNELRNINRLYFNKKWNKNVNKPPDD